MCAADEFRPHNSEAIQKRRREHYQRQRETRAEMETPTYFIIVDHPEPKDWLDELFGY